LVQKSYFNVGIAVDTPHGLLVAVLRAADSKSIGVLGKELAEVAQKARTKGLSMQEMAGGSITISSLGHIGGTGFTPIINAPEVAVLGVSRLQVRAAPAPDGGVMWRKMLPLSLSYDHRVINGAEAARFVCTMGSRLADIDTFL
jgi:pyruvate dehydrogenase E2 component (dihydrolipoamide acetyltransferase)